MAVLSFRGKAIITQRGGGDVNVVEFLYHPIVNAFNESLNVTVRHHEFQKEISTNTSTLLAVQNSPKVIVNIIDIKIIDYLKLLRVTAYVLRLRKPNEQHIIRNKYLTSSEVNDAPKRDLFLDNQATICNGKYRDVTTNLNLKHDKIRGLRFYSRFKNLNIIREHMYLSIEIIN